LRTKEQIGLVMREMQFGWSLAPSVLSIFLLLPPMGPHSGGIEVCSSVAANINLIQAECDVIHHTEDVDFFVPLDYIASPAHYLLLQVPNDGILVEFSPFQRSFNAHGLYEASYTYGKPMQFGYTGLLVAGFLSHDIRQ
jgi:hypothetical protein